MRSLACASFLLALPAPLPAQQKPAADPDPARAFFARGVVVQVRITLDPGERQKLRDKAREYATARLRLDDADFPAVGVKLKGAAGSFREIDDRPGFTLHLGRAGGEARFHGLQRFHLNNGVQDDSLLCEWLGHELFTAAGRPAPRVAHARVWLDGKELGLYVLREAFDKQFLQRVFGTTAGNLYDGGFCQDVDAALEKDSGDGPDDRSDLVALCEGCRGVDDKRAEALAALVDVPAFVDFMALESMLGHWDGYTRNTNNFRLWLPLGGKATFLPHGMDQLFGDADASVLDHPPALVASAVLQQPAFRKRYRERLKALLPLFAPDRLVPRVREVADRLQKELRPADAERARAHADAVRGVIERIQARHRSLEQQVKAPEPKPVPLAVGKALPLKDWHPAPETDRIALAKRAWQGAMALQLQCLDGGDGKPRHGVWRTHLLLARGRYELRGAARCDDVLPPAKDQDGHEHGGVRLRVDGSASERLAGNRGWQPLGCEFEVREFQRTVELACELRALAGRAAFRSDSLQLVRLPD